MAGTAAIAIGIHDNLLGKEIFGWNLSRYAKIPRSITAIEVKKVAKINNSLGLNLFIRKGATPKKQIL